MVEHRSEDAGARLLLVEPNRHAIDDLRGAFAGREFEWEFAVNVQTARRILKQRRMDVLVLDGQLDHVASGGVPALIGELKRGCPWLKVVVFNGVTDRAQQRRMRRLGADGYLSRKSDLSALIRCVRRVLGEAETSPPQQ